MVQKSLNISRNRVACGYEGFVALQNAFKESGSLWCYHNLRPTVLTHKMCIMEFSEYVVLQIIYAQTDGFKL